MYNPEKQYRCTIIRGKSQTDMEDLLPLYANMVHKYTPCEAEQFRKSCYQDLSFALYHTKSYEELPESNLKTIKNHFTEIAGKLLGLYYSTYDEKSGNFYVNESESCKYIVENSDFPIFFKNLCLNFQFPNGAKKINSIKKDIENKINVKPFCFVVRLLWYAQNRPKGKILLTKQEIGYYVLNNLDALQGNVLCEEICERIESDRNANIRRNRLSGSYDWQHIKEQFNLLELANIIETDATNVWLNNDDADAIDLFIKKEADFVFKAYDYDLNKREEQVSYLNDWEAAYGRFNDELLRHSTPDFKISSRDKQKAKSEAIESLTDIGDRGEALVYSFEKERISSYNKRYVNKVLSLGKTKGLGYDILSIEGNDNHEHPDFARYIEVKSTTRNTEPKFGADGWIDGFQMTEREWVAAKQYGEYYNIYRVYFTKTRTIIVRINNPYDKYNNEEIEVYEESYRVNFNSSVIETIYEEKT